MGEGKESNDKIKVVISVALMAAGFITEHTLTSGTNSGIWQAAEMAMYLAAYLIAGFEVLKEAAEGLAHLEMLDEDFLMALASLGAIALGDLAEAAAVMILFSIGEMFEERAEDKSRESIEELLAIRPDYANLCINFSGEEGRTDFELKRTDPQDVQVGDVILVRKGEKTPLDGTLIKGSALLDTAALTGESEAAKFEIGGEILSGTVNIGDDFYIRVTKEFGESTASKIIELVENAAEAKSGREKFITKFAKIYTPAVCILALLLAAGVPAVLNAAGLGYSGIFRDYIYRALVFLVISCPCALVISVPLSFFSGLGAASRAGIIVKGSNFLEGISKAEIFAFDKTGTLTTGKTDSNGFDIVKEGAKAAIHDLTEMGIRKVAVLSGDKEEKVAYIADELGLSGPDAHSGLLPAEKLGLLEELMEGKSNEKSLIYVGDGINDAPSLRRADVGIAMGGIGTDAAIEAADVVIMTDELSKLPQLIRIAQKTLRIAKENIILAIGIKLIILLLGALGMAGMWMAVFADVGVCIIAILNSMRAMK